MTIRNFYKSGISTLSNQRNLRSVGSQLQVHYVVIAGGGAGGSAGGSSVHLRAGGGGAGGYMSSFGVSGANSPTLPIHPLPLGSYTVSIGGGGALGANGSPSTFLAFSPTGGGRGVDSGAAFAGGSGGGAASGGSEVASFAGGAGTISQGFRGGNTTGRAFPGGGGGAGGQGGDGNSAAGLGLASSITGTSVTRAVGGQGGSGQNNGAANTGNGGHGGASFGTGGGGPGGTGGSGVIILRYPSAFTLTIGAGLTGSTSTVEGEKVTTITAGTGNITWS
jgi:hypothetical protein